MRNNSIFDFKFLFFFLLLELIAIVFSFSNFNYISSSSFITGNVYNIIYNLKNYYLLEEKNKKLLYENSKLHNDIISSKIITIPKDFKKEDVKYFQKYIYTPVKIINNSINKQENYITFNKGSIDGIQKDMGVILPNGIGGVIIKTTPHFSTAISLLNLKLKINARLQKNKYFGTLSWDGKDFKFIILNDIPKYCPINIGDIIETDGKSSIFPEGIKIGEIVSYKLDAEHSNYIIKVKLIANFYTIEYAYVVKNLLKKECDIINKVED